MKRLMLCLMVCALAAGAEEVSLRGFGTAELKRKEADGVVYLRIKSESAEKAKLWQAKYLSDMTNTIGHIEAERLGSAWALNLGEGRGYSAAIRKGRTVGLVTAPTREKMIAALEKQGADYENTSAAMEVPMYIDEWDQHAWRFYYWTGMIPKGAKSYDARQDFDYAKKMQSSGMIFWSGPHRADRAAGLDDANQWNWAYLAAVQRNLPVVLNLSVGEPVSTANAYRDQVMTHAPQFPGTYLRLAQPGPAGSIVLSWASDTGRHSLLKTLQGVLKRYNGPQVINVLEPHGELNHGDWTVFIEHGPVADKSFRAFLKQKYGSVKTVAARHRRNYRSWDDVTLPEIAEFAGWNGSAVDLSGPWKVKYLPLADGIKDPGSNTQRDTRPADPPPASYFGLTCDETDWNEIRRMPGDDEMLFVPKKPMVARRTFECPKRTGRQWLYLWDLNVVNKEDVVVSLNGREVGRSPIPFASPHWMVCEVTDALVAGKNQLSVYLPNGFIGYRVYISSTEPGYYPYFPGGLNALWADFSDWQGWSRAKSVEQGIGMIREVEPDKSIISMAPDHYINQLRELNRKHGMRFHNTGYMGCCYAEFLPMLMRSAGLPFSLEPGGPADDLPGFKRLMGYYVTSGVNAIHYFIHIGNILWEPAIKDHFEKIFPALRMMGQYHQPQSDVAMLYDSDVNMLMGYPWRHDGASVSGFWTWRFPDTLAADFQTDGVIPADFSNGIADKYKVIVDSNNMLVRNETRDGIERWVKAGGVFVSMYETGRHTPETADAWTLQSFSGYTANIFSEYRGLRSEPVKRTKLRRADGQTVFVTAPESFNGDGASLKPVAGDTVPLYLWEDGSVAVGLRPYGKGYVVTFGLRLLPSHEGYVRTMLCDVLRWAKVKEHELQMPKEFLPKHYVSNNGLYDVFTIWNASDKDKTYELKFRDGKPRQLFDVIAGRSAETTGMIPAMEFRMFVAPRGATADAADIWSKVQCGYWQGTERPEFKSESSDDSGFGSDVLDLQDGWTVNGKPGALTSWPEPAEGDVREYVAERRIAVPKAWTSGEIDFWCVGIYTGHGCIEGRMKVFLNDKEIAAPGDRQGVAGIPLELKGGDTAVLRLEIKNENKTAIRGLLGRCFLSYTPTAKKVIPLAGDWLVRAEINQPVCGKQTIPGVVTGGYPERTFNLGDVSGRIFLRMKNEQNITGAIINGRYVRRHHHMFGNVTWLDVTPYLNNGLNSIVLCGTDNKPSRSCRIDSVELWQY